ncbi:hypothetical protein [Myxococcus qinghaiensis]|uniref:hypothetical protein n=1 Tax=Myxococcus qinghaiensis TaxID=2906758 RepID=UPI0020A78BAD|nr:hypothetical protein [Myxococcus qinghaiensis]MCP3161686.1 hypothetical protein [Myxococcus qinghaiensis]
MELLVVTDDTVPDPLANLLGALPDLPWRVTRKKVSELLLEHGIRFSQEDAWLSFPETAPALPPSTPVVLNRVIEISDNTRAALSGGTSHLSRGQVTYALTQVLSRYPRVIGTPGVCSPVGNLVPLVNQWRMLEARLPGLKTPRFKYGYGPEPIDPAPFTRAIWKSPFDFYTWKVSDAPPKEHWDSFVVDRPEGIPILASFLGDSTRLVPLAPDVAIPDTVRQELHALTPVLREVFGAIMGECLLFLDGQALTFASFSHHLSASARQPHFQELMLEGLTSELSRAALARA